MNRNVLRNAVLLIVALSLITYFLNNYEYYFTEYKALSQSYPNQDGEVVFEKKYDNKKLIIWKTEISLYVKLLESKWGILHHVSSVAQLSPMSPVIGQKGDISRTWSASLKKNKKYETMFAVESLNPEIKRIYVSNDDIDNVISDDLNTIKQNSTVFFELNIEDGFAAAVMELTAEDTGAFIFRGIDEQGQVVLVGR